MFVMLAYGKRLYGKVDRVPGQHHVATLYWHLCYLPLIPLQSYIILKESRRFGRTNFQGVPIPLSVKSCVMAWIRVPLYAAFFLSTIFAVGTGYELLRGAVDAADVAGLRNVSALTSVLAAATGCLLYATYKFAGIGAASIARAQQLQRVLTGGPQPNGALARESASFASSSVV